MGVGSVSRGFEDLHYGYGFGEINAEGKFVLDFLSAFDLIIADMCFWNREEHLITYKIAVICSQIDFFLIRNSYIKICLDRKVILEKCLTTQNRVLVMDVRDKRSVKRKRNSGAPQIKW